MRCTPSLAEFEQHGYPLPQRAAARIAELEAEIDERVAKLYGNAGLTLCEK